MGNDNRDTGSIDWLDGHTVDRSRVAASLADAERELAKAAHRIECQRILLLECKQTIEWATTRHPGQLGVESMRKLVGRIAMEIKQ